MFRLRLCHWAFFKTLLLTFSTLEAAHRPDLSYWTTSIGNFPFFEYLANPCDYHRVVASPLEELHHFLELQKSSGVTASFVESVYVDIGMAVNSLQAVQVVTGDVDSCSSLKLAYSPAHPPVRKFDEHQTLVSTYEQGIYLITQLYMSIVDRQIINGTNGIPDSEMTFPLDSISASSYLTCGSEPPTLVQLIATLATRLQALLCTVVNGAEPGDRSRFSKALQNLRRTPIYRYTSCTHLEARDCILMDSVHEFLRQSKVAFKKVAREERGGDREGRQRSADGFRDGRYKIVMEDGGNGIEEVY